MGYAERSEGRLSKSVPRIGLVALVLVIAFVVWRDPGTGEATRERKWPVASVPLRFDTKNGSKATPPPSALLGRLFLAVERISLAGTEDLNDVVFTVTPKGRGPEAAITVPLHLDFDDNNVVDPLRNSRVDDVMTFGCGQHAVRVQAATFTNGRPDDASFVVEFPPFYYSVVISESATIPGKDYSPVSLRLNTPQRVQRFSVLESDTTDAAVTGALKSIRCGSKWHNVVLGEVPMTATCELPEGEYDVHALWYGQLLGEATAVVRPSKETFVRITSRHAAALTGQTLVNGQHSVPARVSVWRKPGQVDGEMWSLEAEVLAGKEGRFVIEGLSEGSKRITATLDTRWLAESLHVASDVLQSSLGLLPNTQYVEEFDLDLPSSKSRRRQLPIMGPPLSAGENRDLGILALGGPIDVCLSVTDGNGSPIEDAKVVVDLTEFMSVLKEGQTDGDGKFGISGLTANEAIDISVKKAPFEQYRARLVPEGSVLRAHDGSNVYGTDPVIDGSGKVLCNPDGSVVTRRAFFAQRLLSSQKTRLEFFQGQRAELRIVLKPEAVKKKAEVIVPHDSDSTTEFYYMQRSDGVWLETGGTVDDQPIVLDAEGEYRILVSRLRDDKRSFHYGSIDFSVDVAKWNTKSTLEQLNDTMVRLRIDPTFVDAFEVEGRITYDGDKLSDAMVTLVAGTDRNVYPGTLGGRTTTDRDGEFRLAIPANGPVALQVSKGGFVRRVALDDLRRNPGGRSRFDIPLSK